MTENSLISKKEYNAAYYRANRDKLRVYKAKYNAQYSIDNKEIIKKKCAEHYKKNKEKLKIKSAKWYSENRERAILKMKEYSKKHPEVALESNRKYRKNHPDREREKTARYKAKCSLATPKWADKKKILDVYAHAIFMTEITGVEHQVDHIIPLNGRLVTGLHVHDNLQVLTARENILKGNSYDL